MRQIQIEALILKQQALNLQIVKVIYGSQGKSEEWFQIEEVLRDTTV